MKKFLSIAFIAILLLNVMGYYVLFLGLQYQNDIAMTKVLDAHQYDRSQIFTIKISVSIPYLNNRTDFERIDGKFEHGGEHYRMVMQKFDNDTLTVICIRDNETKRITEALSGYLKTFTDKASTHTGRSKVTLSFIKDYLSEQFSLTTTSIGWWTNIVQDNGCRHLTPTFVSSLTHPPEHS